MLVVIDGVNLVIGPLLNEIVNLVVNVDLGDTFFIQPNGKANLGVLKMLLFLGLAAQLVHVKLSFRIIVFFESF